MKAYKILRRIGEDLVSCNPVLKNELVVKYNQNGETFPARGKLYVFLELENAENFLLRYCNWYWDFEIWEVEVKDLTPAKIVYFMKGEAIELYEAILRFWDGETKLGQCLNDSGARMCDSLKLVCKIKSIYRKSKS